MAGFREQAPRDLGPLAGVQEETQWPPAQAVGGRCQYSCPRWLASQREALRVEGIQSCLAKAQGEVQVSSGKTLTYQLQEARAHYGPAPHKACWESTG